MSSIIERFGRRALFCAFAAVILAASSARVDAQGTQDIANRLNSSAGGETGAQLRRYAAALAADPSLSDLTAWILQDHADELTPYQRAVLELLPYLAANADLLAMPDPASTDPARWEQFKNMILGSEAGRAILADGDRVLQNPAELQQRLGAVANELGSMTSDVPPTPEESCGGGSPSSLTTVVTQGAGDGATSDVSGALQSQISKPEFADYVREQGAPFAAALQPQTDLPLAGANGRAQPVFNLGKFIKGVVIVAAAVVSVAVSVCTAGSAAAVGGAIVLGLVAAEGGVQTIIDATMEAAGCAPDAITCSPQRPCAVGMCSSGCCITVGAASAALVRAKILACSANSDCERGDYCENGCCALIEPE